MAQALIALLFQPTFSPCHVIDILLILMGLIWLSSEVKFLLVFLLIFLVVAFFVTVNYYRNSSTKYQLHTIIHNP